MKKLHELTMDELKALYKKNQEFASKVWEMAYDNAMFWQSERFEELFGKNYADNSIEYNDHYNSFYLSLKDGEKFALALNEKTIEDLFDEETYKDYQELVGKVNQWQNMDWEEQERNEELEGEIEERAKNLLQVLEDDLHSFENITEDDTDEVLTSILDNVAYMSDWETDGEKVYETIVQCYE